MLGAPFGGIWLETHQLCNHLGSVQPCLSHGTNVEWWRLGEVGVMPGGWEDNTSHPHWRPPGHHKLETLRESRKSSCV